jgi:hypothetical protein
VERTFQFEQQTSGDEWRKCEEHHRGRHQRVPGVERDQVDPHAGWPAFEHADNQFDGRGDGRNLDEGEAEQPDIGTDVRLVCRRERRVHEPAAARRGIEEQRAAQEDAADDEGPEPEGREPRKRQIASPLYLGQDEDGERLENRDREKEHHHGAVDREDLVVALGREEVVVRECELNPHQQRERAAEEEKHARRGRVPDAHVLVVHRRPVAPALRRLPGLEQPIGLRALNTDRRRWPRFDITVHCSPPR